MVGIETINKCMHKSSARVSDYHNSSASELFDLVLGDPEALDKVRHDQNGSKAASRLVRVHLSYV